MKCQNCGEQEANIRYTQIVNGVKEELHLCSECAEKLGLDEMDFSMPIDFSSFFGEFLEDNNTDVFQEYFPKQEQCHQCGMTFDEFANTGKFGCANCYQVFQNQLQQLLKNIQGSDTHVGRKAMVNTKQEKEEKQKQVKEKKTEEVEETTDKIEELKQELKQAIQIENYEKAAEIRDEIKQWEEE